MTQRVQVGEFDWRQPVTCWHPPSPFMERCPENTRPIGREAQKGISSKIAGTRTSHTPENPPNHQPPPINRGVIECESPLSCALSLLSSLPNVHGPCLLAEEWAVAWKQMLDQKHLINRQSIHYNFYDFLKFATAPQRFLARSPGIVLTSPQQRRRARAQPQSLITGHRCSATGSRRKSGEITSPKDQAETEC